MSRRSATFNTALLADAVSKAAKVAPLKGAAFDKSAGVVLEVYADHTIVKATDIVATYRQVVALEQTEGIESGPVIWRLPSALLSNLLSAMILGAGKTVRFVDSDDSSMRILSGATAAKVSLFPADFPEIEPFDQSAAAPANDFASRLAMVPWACDKRSLGPLSGVHISGTHLVATDGTKLAMMPCTTPLPEPVTVAAGTIAPLLKSATDVRIAATDTRFQIGLDAETQVTTQIIMGAYPKYEVLLRDNFSGAVRLDRLAVIDTIDRMLTVVDNGDKFPHLAVTIDGGTRKVALDMTTRHGDRIRDEIPFAIDADAGAFDGTVTVGTLPFGILQALKPSNADTVKFSFGHTDPTKVAKATLHFEDPSGYMAIVSAKVATGGEA